VVLVRGNLYLTFSSVSFAWSKITSSEIAISARIALQQKIIQRLETGSSLTGKAPRTRSSALAHLARSPVPAAIESLAGNDPLKP
jgi:hypothetical protein